MVLKSRTWAYGKRVSVCSLVCSTVCWLCVRCAFPCVWTRVLCCQPVQHARLASDEMIEDAAVNIRSGEGLPEFCRIELCTVVHGSANRNGRPA